MVYTSHQAHHSVRKAAMLAGIPPANVRSLATDERLRLDVAALEAEISRDLQRGRRPFLVVSAAGTTNTGAIDPLEAIGEVCRDHGLWHHVDAAYGGAFILCEAGRERLRGISSADSVAFDPHKGMFLPYGIGCLLVREGERLRQAHRSEAEYLQDLTVPDDSRAFSPADYGPELSRGFRGLQLWLPLMLHGARPFREALTEKLALTESLYDKLVALQAEGLPLELVDPPQLTTIAFRLTRRADESLEDWSKRNGALLRAINGGQRVHLSSTQLPLKTGTVATLRACILCFRTHAPEIEAAATAIERALRSSGDAQP
jgi:aromatic-L-amino-acid decarboxylase